MKDKSILQGFRGFGGKYLHFDIKREEISLIMEGEGLFLLRIEYFTSLLPINKELNLSRSVSNYAIILDQKNPELEENQNLQTDENTEVYDISERPLNEKEFFKKILPIVCNNKKVVIQNKNKIENVVSSMIRYVIFNSTIYLIIISVSS